MKTVALPLTGRCQCGNIQYSVTEAPIMIYACHCTGCQTQTGSAFVLSATILETSFSLTSGEPSRYSWTADSGNGRYATFCPDCGTRILNGGNPSVGFYSLRAGTFDDTSWIRPAGHIWQRSAQPWFRPEPDDILFDQQPEDYTTLIERFVTLQKFE